MSNQAAWLNGPSVALEVGPAPMYTPEPDEVVIKIHAVAMNPMEAMIQRSGMLLEEFPAILGADGAGTIHAMGSNVKGFSVGDRVMACFDGVPPFPKADYRKVSFQNYAVARSNLTAKLPETLSFREASTLPLCVTAAADGLFAAHGMELDRPRSSPGTNSSSGTVLVWGGSSGVGAAAIQLLVSAGYEVGAVAGAKNRDLCLATGAKHVFDHSSPTVVDDIAKTYANTSAVHIFSAIMSKEAMEKVTEVYTKLGGKGEVGSAIPPGIPLPYDVPLGLDVRRAHGSFMSTSEIGKFIWQEWLPTALHNGSMKNLLEIVVVGKGLGDLQATIDKYFEGVSGQKLVVDVV